MGFLPFEKNAVPEIHGGPGFVRYSFVLYVQGLWTKPM